MLNIAEFLKKFKKFSLDKESQKKEITDVFDLFNISLQKFTVKDKVIRIQENSIIKNQIFIKKQKILEKLPHIKDIL